MTENEILYKWERNGLEKRNMGTAAHRNCELALEGLPFRWYDPEMVALLHVYQKKWVGKIVLGVNNASQLQKNIQVEYEVICCSLENVVIKALSYLQDQDGLDITTFIIVVGFHESS